MTYIAARTADLTGHRESLSETTTFDVLPAAETVADIERQNIDAAWQAIRSMAVVEGDEVYYKAGEIFQSSFTRDSLTTMFMIGDLDMLQSQVAYSARYIGRSRNPYTGEEPGKAHHELPGHVNARERDSSYSACDTTALLLLGITALADHGDQDALDRYKEVIELGVGYITEHTNDQKLFFDDPRLAGDENPDGRARRFHAKVTYWKDSELNREGSREPNYPIVYSLAHFQNAWALEEIGRITGNEDWQAAGREMSLAGLSALWNKDHFVTAIDGDGVTDTPSSDSLHALLYIPPERLQPGQAEAVQDYMRVLETGIGYRSTIELHDEFDPYHTDVWTHEQALLHAAAIKHGLPEAAQVAQRVGQCIRPLDHHYPEHNGLETYDPRGNFDQLWAMGAYLYFQNPDAALL